MEGKRKSVPRGATDHAHYRLIQSLSARIQRRYLSLGHFPTAVVSLVTRLESIHDQLRTSQMLNENQTSNERRVEHQTSTDMVRIVTPLKIEHKCGRTETRRISISGERSPSVTSCSVYRVETTRE